jgi:MoaE-MoaD fusion protein
MRVWVLYFAAARERAGTSREELEVSEEATVSSLLARLAERHPGLGPLLPHLRVAVNQEFASTDQPLSPGAEVALIPPVSGGAGPFRVTDERLSLEEVVQAVAGEAFGGLVTFVGNVRAQTRGKRVLRLEYEAYRPMAERLLEKLGEEVAERWPGARVAIVHRVGVLEPGEWAVVIAAAAPHRQEAFRACEHAIDRLKQDAPIWKKEVFADGEVWVGLGP